jgi:hypothetical protein
MFDYRILTDCYAVSIQFIHNDHIKKDEKKKQLMKKGRNEAKTQYKNLSSQEVQKLKDDKIKSKKDSLEKFKNEKKDAFNKLSKIDQNKIKMEAKKSREENKLRNIEFPYIDELSDNKIEQLKIQNKVYVDPGPVKKLCFLILILIKININELVRPLTE